MLAKASLLRLASISKRKSPSVDIYVSVKKRILAGRFSEWTYLATETPLTAAEFVEVLARLVSIHTPSCPVAAADKEITLTVIGFVIKRRASREEKSTTSTQTSTNQAFIDYADLVLPFNVSRCVEVAGCL